MSSKQLREPASKIQVGRLWELTAKLSPVLYMLTQAQSSKKDTHTQVHTNIKSGISYETRQSKHGNNSHGLASPQHGFYPLNETQDSDPANNTGERCFVLSSVYQLSLSYSSPVFRVVWVSTFPKLPLLEGADLIPDTRELGREALASACAVSLHAHKLLTAQS